MNIDLSKPDKNFQTLLTKGRRPHFEVIELRNQNKSVSLIAKDLFSYSDGL